MLNILEAGAASTYLAWRADGICSAAFWKFMMMDAKWLRGTSGSRIDSLNEDQLSTSQFLFSGASLDSEIELFAHTYVILLCHPCIVVRMANS